MAFNHQHDQEELRLHHKRAWLFSQIDRAMLKRRYPHLIPEDRPDYPKWRVWFPEAIGVLVVAVGAGIVAIVAHKFQAWWIGFFNY